jgi:[ribosomal protein S5]-alanine N-acetyltransferase
LIETPRLLLRPLRDDDIGALFEIQGDPHAMRFTYAAPSPEECARRLRAHEALRAENGFAPWVAALRDDERVVGWGGLGLDPFDPGWGPEVSYFFHPAHWGRGLATELVRASVEHGFGALALPAIGAFARPENAASIRVLEKCGFRLLGWEPALERNHYEATRSGLG